MSATEKMAEQRAMNKELSKLVPETLKGFMALEHGATKNGVLGAKEKEFIALGIAIAKPAWKSLHQTVSFGRIG